MTLIVLSYVYSSLPVCRPARKRAIALMCYCAPPVNQVKCAKFSVTRHPIAQILLVFLPRLGHRIEQPLGLCLRSGTRLPGKSTSTLCAD